MYNSGHYWPTSSRRLPQRLPETASGGSIFVNAAYHNTKSSRPHINPSSLLLHITSVIYYHSISPIHKVFIIGHSPSSILWSWDLTELVFSQISRSQNAYSGMQFLTCGISFRHLFVFHLQVLSHLYLIHIMDHSVTCLTVHFILVLKLILSSSPFLHRSVSSFSHWSAGTFNCPLCGRIWRFKCRQVRQI